MPVQVQGPDGQTYQFPDGTDKAAAIAYFKKKGIGVKAAAFRASHSGQPAPSGSALKRFGAAALAPIKGAAESLLNANPTPEEKAKGLTSGYDFWTRPFERVAEAQTGQVDEASDLAKQGRYSEAAGHALASAVPLLGPWVADAAQQYYGELGAGDVAGALGTAAGNTALAFAPDAIGKAKELAPRAADIAARPLRAMTGTGVRTVRGLVKDVEAENAAAAAKYQDDLAKARSEHASELLRLKQEYDQRVRASQAKAQAGTVSDRAEHAQKEAEAQKEYREKTQKANEKFEKDKASADQENAKARAKYEKDKAEAERSNAEAQREYNRKIGKTVQKNRQTEEAQRADRTRKGNIQVQGSRIISGLSRLDESLRARANGMYDAVRGKVGNATEPGQDLGAATRQALQKIAGSTERPKVFKDILSKYPEAEPDTIEYQGAQIQKGTPLYDVLRQHGATEVPTVSFGDLQGYYSELGSELSKGNLPADVYQATKALQESVGNLMQRMANKAGAGKDLIAARQFYRDYMDTFHAPQGPSGSGSPVAQALDAKDPLRAVDYFAGKSGDRGIAMLRKYDPDLANLAQEAQRNAHSKPPVPRPARQSIADLPSPQVKPVPEEPAGQPGPKRPSNVPLPPVFQKAPAPRAANLELPPIMPPEPEAVVPHPELRKIGPEDIRAAKAEKLEKAAHTVAHRGSWAATWPILEALRSGLRGAAPHLGSMAAESVGTLAAVHGVARLMESKPVVDFLTTATPRDIAAIPPDLRGDFPAIVRRAQAQGIKVSPALRVTFGTAGALAPRRENATDEWAQQ